MFDAKKNCVIHSQFREIAHLLKASSHTKETPSIDFRINLMKTKECIRFLIKISSNQQQMIQNLEIEMGNIKALIRNSLEKTPVAANMQ